MDKAVLRSQHVEGHTSEQITSNLEVVTVEGRLMFVLNRRVYIVELGTGDITVSDVVDAEAISIPLITRRVVCEHL